MHGTVVSSQPDSPAAGNGFILPARSYADHSDFEAPGALVSGNSGADAGNTSGTIGAVFSSLRSLFAVVSLLTDGLVARIYAALFGAALVLALTIWVMGG